MWHIKNADIFYNEAKIITEMQEKLLTRGGVYILRNFQEGNFFLVFPLLIIYFF